MAALIVTGERGAETEADSPYHIPLNMYNRRSETTQVRIFNINLTN